MLCRAGEPSQPSTTQTPAPRCRSFSRSRGISTKHIPPGSSGPTLIPKETAALQMAFVQTLSDVYFADAEQLRTARCSTREARCTSAGRARRGTTQSSRISPPSEARRWRSIERVSRRRCTPSRSGSRRLEAARGGRY
ncbi:hypothetical protein K466DRAFT_160408 [Polyporus arcularius HHB13444]|uniref:Uncharacterized protein n=1 Tax=Polyporus arcularius HHB13444 TaxID=1314778 RepID=A0A5C3PTE1_9APHY|nr:hypothetical protein K466DRAFT_160408 [Polyporus arcularius HHB13444]